MNYLISILFMICGCLMHVQSSPLSGRASDPMESKYFQGDMRGIKFSNTSGTLILENSDSNGLWLYGTIPYTFDSNVYTSAETDMIKSMMKLIEDQTRMNGRDCIKFIARSDEKPYLKFFNGNGCYSYIGRQKTGLFSNSQEISIKRGACMYRGVILHELLHALGLHHEHSRPDRDNFLAVYNQNMESGNNIHFQKYNTQPVSSLGVPYDYNSIMHYDSFIFSVNGLATMLPKQSGVKLTPIAQKQILSNSDVIKIRNMYNCM